MCSAYLPTIDGRLNCPKQTRQRDCIAATARDLNLFSGDTLSRFTADVHGLVALHHIGPLSRTCVLTDRSSRAVRVGSIRTYVRTDQPESPVLPTSYPKGLSSPCGFLSPAFDWLPDLFSESLYSSWSSRTPLSATFVAYDALFERSPRTLLSVDDDPLTPLSPTGCSDRLIRNKFVSCGPNHFRTCTVTSCPHKAFRALTG